WSTAVRPGSMMILQSPAPCWFGRRGTHTFTGGAGRWKGRGRRGSNGRILNASAKIARRWD
ncbi:MAG: hypothetical protein WAU74_01285, partial [Pseudolabrys sp.]